MKTTETAVKLHHLWAVDAVAGGFRLTGVACPKMRLLAVLTWIHTEKGPGWGTLSILGFAPDHSAESLAGYAMRPPEVRDFLGGDPADAKAQSLALYVAGDMIKALLTGGPRSAVTAFPREAAAVAAKALGY